MKSNICLLSGLEGQLDAVLSEVEKCTNYNQLDHKSALRVRLLAEELVGMLPALMEHAEGKFWIENDEGKYELHVSMKSKNTDYMTRERLLSVSSTGKNAAAVGIMGKIRAAAELLLFPADVDVPITDFIGFDMDADPYFTHSWSLRQYEDMVSTQVESDIKQEAWDELEKSIIARLADDVLVGIKGSQVDIIVRKAFA